MSYFNNDLITDLLSYSEDKSMEIKVRRVYHMCIRQGHMQLADKIEHKYSRYMFKSDLAIAFGYSLMALKQKDDDKL